jgi:transposase
MIEIKEVLRRWQAGHSVRKIGRDTSVGRKAAARYIHWAVELGVPRDRELRDEDVHAVAQCVQSPAEHDESDERRAVAQHREAIEKWLSEKPPLRLSKVHTLLKRRGLEVSYATVRRFAMQELGWHKKKSTIRLEDPPAGQEAQIDFGRMGHLVDPETGRRRTLWALLVTLSFSRYQFVWPTFRQTTEAICEGLDQAWWFFDAVPVTIVPDNMTGIVKKPDALDAELCDAFLDYVQARNIFVDPARIRRPKDKARVENQVPFARESWFAGEEFRDLDEARQSAAYWSAETAGRRIHGTTRQVPREVFETVEKAAMQPAPSEPFDVPLWGTPTVHADHHIQVKHALYSVPSLYLHKQVRARADKKLVRIYFGTELIKVHPRKPPGGRSTDVSDYPTEKQGYALRSVDRVIAQARARGEHTARYAERILAGPLPWARMRAAYALLRLCDKYGPGRVEAVCQSALAFDVIDVRRIKRMLETAARPPAQPESGKATVTQLPHPRFARDAKHFETRPRTTDKDGSK